MASKKNGISSQFTTNQQQDNNKDNRFDLRIWCRKEGLQVSRQTTKQASDCRRCCDGFWLLMIFCDFVSGNSWSAPRRVFPACDHIARGLRRNWQAAYTGDGRTEEQFHSEWHTLSSDIKLGRICLELNKTFCRAYFIPQNVVWPSNPSFDTNPKILPK